VVELKLRSGRTFDKIEGNVVAEKGEFEIRGMIAGNLETKNNAYVVLHGMICGTLFALETSRVIIHGMVTDSLVIDGGDVEVYGMICKDVTRKKGKVWVDKNAKITGRFEDSYE